MYAQCYTHATYQHVGSFSSAVEGGFGKYCSCSQCVAPEQLLGHNRVAGGFPCSVCLLQWIGACGDETFFAVLLHTQSAVVRCAQCIASRVAPSHVLGVASRVQLHARGVLAAAVWFGRLSVAGGCFGWVLHVLRHC